MNDNTLNLETLTTTDSPGSENNSQAKSREAANTAVGCGCLSVLVIAFVILVAAKINRDRSISASSEVFKLRLEQLQKSIDDVSALETLLDSMKKDLLSMQSEKERLSTEIARIKDLSQLNEKQVSALSYVINHKSWYDWAVDNGISFVLGFAASMIASVVYGRYSSRRSKKA